MTPIPPYSLNNKKGEPLPARLARLVRIALSGTRERRQVEQTRCERGAAIARKAGFGEDVGSAIGDLHEHWDGDGLPFGRRRSEIHLFARTLAACAALDVFNSVRGPAAAIEMLARRRGSWYDPEIVDALLAGNGRAALDALFVQVQALQVAAVE